MIGPGNVRAVDFDEDGNRDPDEVDELLDEFAGFEASVKQSNDEAGMVSHEPLSGPIHPSPQPSVRISSEAHAFSSTDEDGTDGSMRGDAGSDALSINDDFDDPFLPLDLAEELSSAHTESTSPGGGGAEQPESHTPVSGDQFGVPKRSGPASDADALLSDDESVGRALRMDNPRLSVLFGLWACRERLDEWVAQDALVHDRNRDEHWGQAVLGLLTAQAERFAMAVVDEQGEAALAVLSSGAAERVAAAARAARSRSLQRDALDPRIVHVGDLVRLVGAVSSDRSEERRLRAQLGRLRGDPALWVSRRWCEALAPWLVGVAQVLHRMEGVHVWWEGARGDDQWTLASSSGAHRVQYAMIAAATRKACRRASSVSGKALPDSSLDGEDPEEFIRAVAVLAPHRCLLRDGRLHVVARPGLAEPVRITEEAHARCLAALALRYGLRRLESLVFVPSVSGAGGASGESSQPVRISWDPGLVAVPVIASRRAMIEALLGGLGLAGIEEEAIGYWSELDGNVERAS